jgi:hypothetical protein
MGERKSREYLNKLKKKLDVDIIYSWSRYHKAVEDPYSYLLNYIKHEKEIKKDSIYGVSGGICHDILERYYLGELKYEDMLNEYEEKLFEMNAMDLKYNRIDEEANKKIADKYENNVRLFFQQYKPIESKMVLEQFVTIKVGRFYFQGYIDFVHRDSEGNYIIEDFKTSTIYTGAKKIAEGGQLILYSESLIQKGVPLDKIKIRWNFLKYCSIVSDLFSIDKETKKNKTKSKNCSRASWVKESEGNIKKWLTKSEMYDELEIEDMIQTCIENNSLETLPQDIQDRFKIEDCYVYLDLTQEMIDDLKDSIINTLEEIELKTAKTKEILKEIESLDKIKDKQQIKELNQEIDEMFWSEIDSSKEYYYYNLMGYTRQQHKPWDEYLKDVNMFVEDSFDKDEIGDSLDWLKDL